MKKKKKVKHFEVISATKCIHNICPDKDHKKILEQGEKMLDQELDIMYDKQQISQAFKILNIDVNS